MQIIKAKNYDDAGAKAAEIIAAQIVLKPRSVLGLATGATSVGIYRRLVELYKNKELDFSEITTFNLDEYIGLSAEDTQSYRYFMQENFFRHINILQENTHLPNGLENDAVTECMRYENLIQKNGGIDLQLLGIGHNGHIGFNEPSGCFVNNTNLVCLAQRTIEANRIFFDSEKEVPRRAYTMGIGTIMRARRIVMVVSGRDKADIIKRAFTGHILPEVPASVLQFHSDFTLVGDDEALSLL